VQKPLREGTFPIGMNEDYIAWGINSVCHGIVTASPFAGHISLVFYLNRLYLTLMGMHLPASALIGTHTIIRQPELIDIGERTVIGIGCVLSGHYSPNQTEHCHGRIHIGANTLVGMRTVIGGPVSIGDRTLIGADTNIFPNAHIGSDAKIGPFCRIQVGSRIPDRAIIKADSFISASMSIKEGETWAGNPAVCIHSPTNTPEENIDHGNA
jgi:carbonic anhydrase/acetyltransferase-like protein (isoleucine patch superfamily)